MVQVAPGDGSGLVILLCGPSSVGKTTAATALQGLLRSMSVYWPQEAVTLSVPAAVAPSTPESAVALEEAAAHAYFASLAGYARRGFVVIGETWFWGPPQWAAWKKSTEEVHALCVRLHAADGVLSERESRRGDRFPGTAAVQSRRGLEADWDLVLDSGQLAAVEVAEAIAASLGTHPWAVEARPAGPTMRQAPESRGSVEQTPVAMRKTGSNGPTVRLADDVVMLRLWSKDDAAFMADACTDPAIRRYNAVPTPYSVKDAEKTIEDFAATWLRFDTTGRPSGVAFAIVDQTSGEAVGLCGIDEWSREDVAQIGYWLAPTSRRHGYATRAVVLLTRWLFELGAARVFLTVVATNEKSIAVARRAGFVYEGTMRSQAAWQGRRFDVLWFAALPQEWPAGDTTTKEE